MQVPVMRAGAGGGGSWDCTVHNKNLVSRVLHPKKQIPTVSGLEDFGGPKP